MIRFTGEHRRHWDDQLWIGIMIMNGRTYVFDNMTEGKAFYEFWKKH
jgi:hypothetical protein